MSKTNKIFESVPVEVPDHSGFDKSYEWFGTVSCGTITPVYCEPVMPNDYINISPSMSWKFPPFAVSPVGMRTDVRLTAFFVPNRILWAGWQNFYANSANGAQTPSIYSGQTPTTVPTINVAASSVDRFKAGTLADYLGIKILKDQTFSQSLNINALPFIGYKKIIDDWYRNSLLQKPFFNPFNANTDNALNISNITNYGHNVIFNNVTGSAGNGLISKINGENLLDLNQVLYSRDVFTTCNTRPQNGAAAELQFTVTDSTGSFSIASLRAANALQKYLERNQLAGNNYYDSVMAHFGVRPADAHLNRSILLGSMTAPLTTSDVNQTAQNADYRTNNPFDTIGASFSKGAAFGSQKLVDNFHATEAGYIFILADVRPHSVYGTGSKRHLFELKVGDIPMPEFSHIGDAPVYQREIVSNVVNSGIFGYQDRYYNYKANEDEVHGQLRDGEDLSIYVNQRSFTNNATLGSEFISVSTDALDGQIAINQEQLGFTAMGDIYFDAQYIRCLPEYSTPRL